MSARTRFFAGPIRRRTHRSAPTWGGRYSETREIGVKRTLPQRGGTEPAPYGSNRAGRSTAGCGHPALRVQHRWCPAKGRCRHRPLRKVWEVSSTTRASGAQRSVCAAVARKGWKSEQRASPKCPATSDNPSATAKPCQLPLHKGALGTGDADCRVGPAGLLAMTMDFCHSEASAHTGRGNPSFLRWTGVWAAPRKTRGTARRVVVPYGKPN